MMKEASEYGKAESEMVKRRYGKTLGASKGKAPVSSKPKVKARPTGGLKPDGFKASATWKF